VWRGWATTSSTATTAAVWQVWCGYGSGSADTTTTADCYATTASTGVWTVWVTTSDGQTRRVSSGSTGAWKAPPPRELTPEEKAEVAARQQAARERQAEERRKWEEAEAKRRAEEEAADKRAEELLVAHLDAEQREEYRRDRSFQTRDRHGRRYRIHRAWSGHVTRLDDAGRPVERFCIHPSVRVPLPDNQLLAKLMLETDPETFRKTANVTPMPAGVN